MLCFQSSVGLGMAGMHSASYCYSYVFIQRLQTYFIRVTF